MSDSLVRQTLELMQRPSDSAPTRKRGPRRGNHAIDVQIGQRIRARRIELELTQQELADRLKMTYQNVHKYETALVRIYASRLVEVAAALEVPVVYFFEDDRSDMGDDDS